MEQSIVNWLFLQAPVVVVLGFAVRWLSIRYEKSEDEKMQLAKEKMDLAQDVIKLTVAYENKLDTDKDKSEEIKQILQEIREEIRKWQK